MTKSNGVAMDEDLERLVVSIEEVSE